MRASAWPVVLVALALSTALVGCSSKQESSRPDPTGAQPHGLIGPYTVTLSAPNPVAPIAPVLNGINSVYFESGANVVSGTTVAMGRLGGGVHAEPDTLINETWSRGTAEIRDRVHVRGTLHAVNQQLVGNNIVIDSADRAPMFDPPSTLSWSVTYPNPTVGSSVTVNAGQVQTLAPGQYGDILVNSRGTLNLSSGTYYLKSLDIELQSTVNLNQANGPVIIYENDKVILRGSFVAPAGSSPDLLIVELSSTAINVESLFDGAIVAPFAIISFNAVTGVHTGFFYGQDIQRVRAGAKVQYRAPLAILTAARASGQTCQQMVAAVVLPSQLSDAVRKYCGGGICGSHDDTDHDGVEDCTDSCPYDPLKTTPGLCGCNVSDVDSDGDGVPDCKDKCQLDPNNTVPGQCGCVGQIGLEPAGAPCTDTACPQSGATCNGAGVCGNPAACSPCTGGRLIKDYGISYWFCGVTFPRETGPDGGPEVVSTGAPGTEATAQSSCSARGLTLTRIDTPDENRFVARYLTAPIWLGANDIQTSGQWRWSLPNSNSGDLLWSGGPTGSRQNGLYSNWAPGVPNGAPCASMVPEGHWFDISCGQALGWVCKYRSPPPGFSVDAGVNLPGPSQPVPLPAGPCINPFDLDAGGLPDSLAELAREVDAARSGVFIGAAARPPSDASTCPVENPAANTSKAIGLVPDSGAGCSFANARQIFSPDQGIDGGPPALIDCASDTDCVNAFDSSYMCRVVNDDPACSPPDAGAHGLDAGSCRGHALCVQLTCPRPTNNRCREVRLCSPTTTAFDAAPDPSTNLDAGRFDPASLFAGGPSDAATADEYYDPPKFDGAAHTWCHMDPQNPVANADQPRQNTGGSTGQGSPISFTFDPNLTFHVNANPLALGENGMDVHAAAKLKASVQLNNFLGQNYSADIVDIGAGVHALRCSVTNDETQFMVLGLDVISALGLGIPRFNSADQFPTQTKDCNDAVANFSFWANRAKKAYRDAQQLLVAYKNIKSQGLGMVSTLCQDIMSTVGANEISFFPGGLVCPEGEPIEITINRFVDYLQLPGFGQISQLRNAATSLADKSSKALEKVVPQLNVTFLDIQRDESQTILNVPFAIGPVPMVLQVDVFANYGIAGRFDLELHTPIAQIAGLDSQNTQSQGDTPIHIAHVDVTVMPYAGAGLSAFVGAGTDLGPFGATVGIEGKVSLAQVSAPIFAGAGLDLLEQFDPRPIPPDISSVSVPSAADGLRGLGSLFHFSKPKSFNFLVWFDYGAGIQLTNVLSGEIDAELNIDFFFFSETWRSQIVKYNGWTKFFNLISGNFGANTTQRTDNTLGSKHATVPEGTNVVKTSDQGGPSMGVAQSQFPLTVLASLVVPDAGPPADAATVPFDASAVQSFFYDNQCCAHNQETCKPVGAGVPQCCADYQCVLPTPDAGTGACQPVCVAQGNSCKTGAPVGCCGSLFCGPARTCIACLEHQQTCDDDAGRSCCTGQLCKNNACCTDNQGACNSDSDCCFGNMCLGDAGARTCGRIIP